MRRVNPQAELALPPISQVDIVEHAGAWTVTEHKRAVGYKAPKAPKAARFDDPAPRPQGNGKRIVKIANADSSEVPKSARGIPGERSLALTPAAEIQMQLSANYIDMSPPPQPASPTSACGGGAGSTGPQNAVKGRAIERWLNHALGQAGSKPTAQSEGARASTTAKQNHGLAHFGIDVASLEKIGLDAASAERVYRAMFVYSQGLHAVLQEAVGRAKSSPQALLVLWRAFTTVLEHAGESEHADSLAALVQRGNEEEHQRVEVSLQEKISGLQAQVEKLAADRRLNQEEVQRYREDEMRLRNESEMYRNEHEVVMKKYEQEIKQRIDAEARFLDKTREAENLQEALTKEQARCRELTSQLHQESSDRKAAQLELDSLRTQMKIADAKALSLQQSLEEARQQKQRQEQQVSQLRQQLDRVNQKNLELKEQLEHETERVKQLTEQHSIQQRELRKLERTCEDDEHIRREVQNERDLLREKLERIDKDLADTNDEKRDMQKQLNELSIEHRTNQLELRRKTEQLEKADGGLEKLGMEHRELLDSHRALSVEVESLREDVAHYEQQVTKESGLRKQLQQQNKQLQGHLQVVQVQLDNTKMAVTSMQKELQEVTETKVKLESIARDTKSAMQKQALEHQVELRAHTMKVSMLEKIIADERAERRKLVQETQDVTAKRDQDAKALKTKDFEIRDLKRQRLEKEEEVARQKVLLQAQDQRNSAHLVTVDKYHAAVANQDAETRQMQVLLESERAEAKRQLKEMSDVCAAAEFTLTKRIEHWKMCFEDTWSQLNFNPATAKMQNMEAQISTLEAELLAAKKYIAEEAAKVAARDNMLGEQKEKMAETESQLKHAAQERDMWKSRCAEVVQDYEREAVARTDSEMAFSRIKSNTENFDELKSQLEKALSQALEENAVLHKMINKPMQDAETQVTIHSAATAVQTDLSYQYLEKNESLHQDRCRRERLAILKNASHFLEDAEEGRDFTADFAVAKVGGGGSVINLALTDGPASKRPLVHVGPNANRSIGPGLPPPQAPEPWPSGRPPPGWPPQQAQAVRSVTHQAKTEAIGRTFR
jgi:hypothetical protein